MSTLLPPELRDFADYVSLLSYSLDDLVALRVERDGGDRIPVPSVTRPAARVARTGLLVELVPGLQDCPIFPGVALRGTHVTDATVSVVMVVPGDEGRGPLPGLLEV